MHLVQMERLQAIHDVVVIATAEVVSRGSPFCPHKVNLHRHSRPHRPLNRLLALHLTVAKGQILAVYEVQVPGSWERKDSFEPGIGQIFESRAFVISLQRLRSDLEYLVVSTYGRVCFSSSLREYGRLLKGRTSSETVLLAMAARKMTMSRHRRLLQNVLTAIGVVPVFSKYDFRASVRDSKLKHKRGKLVNSLR